MAALDWVFLAVLAFSVLLGGWRGLVYEVLSVAGWVAAFVLAQWFAPDVAAWLPMGESAQPLRYAAAFALVFIGGAFVAGMLAWLAKKMIEAVGLRPIDRVLGAAFGLVRGVVIVLAVAVVFHMTPLKEAAMWSESAGAPLATATLKGLKPILPESFGRYLPG